MAERKPSGFRFRLPWLLQPALTSRPAIAPEPPRSSTQTSVSTTSSQRPPFRPPGIAPPPVAPPPTVATPTPPPPASPTRAQPRPASSPPPVPAKSSAPKSAIAKTLDPVANKPTKETQTTSEITDANYGETQPAKETQAAKEMVTPATPPAIDKVVDTTKAQTTSETPGPVAPLAAARTAMVDQSQPTKETQAAKGMATPPVIDKGAATIETQTPAPAVSLVAARTAKAGETQAATETASPTTPPAIAKVADTNETQTTRETPGPAVPFVAARTAEAGGSQLDKETQAATEMASPATPPAVAKVANAIETQPTKETLTTTGTKPTVETPAPATLGQSPPFRPPVNIQPLQTDTSPRSPSRLVSQLINKPSSLPSSSSITTTAVLHNTPEIKRSTDSINVPQGADFALDAKPKEIAKAKGEETKSSNPHSIDKITETKSQKSKAIASDRVSLHREIKDDVFKFIRKMATNPSKRYMDEKPESVVTVAGDNTGASMHLGSDVIKRGYKVNSDRTARDAAINGEGSSTGKKSRRDSKSSENQETTAVVNSNIQGINNSMMFNSSVTERNPGVHLGFSCNLANSNDSKMENRESMETHRAEANISPQQTLVYDPIIGRCVEGDSMEACDLEADDSGNKSYEIEVV